jgi:phospholipase D3/4
MGKTAFMFRLYLACFLICFSTVSVFAETAPLRLVQSRAQGGNTETVWLGMINKAQHSIEIGSFFFNSAPHSSMDKVLQALKQAADRGVSIRILIDAAMQANSQPTLQRLAHKNIEHRAIDFESISGGVMHAKYMIVDERDVFVGSQNFGWKAMAENHETGLMLPDVKLAKTILQVFNLDWERSVNKPVTGLDPHVVNQHHPLTMDEGSLFVAFSPKKGLPTHLSFELPVLLQLIDSAKKEIDIDVYEYSDLAGRGRRPRWTVLDEALITAARRGVQIHLIVSEAMLNRKAGFKGLSALRHISNLQIKVSHLPPLQGRKKTYSRVDHSKFMLIDEEISWIGTGNWEKGYFYNSRDMAIIIHNKGLHAQLNKDFMGLWNGNEIRDLPE